MSRLPDLWRDLNSPFAPASYFGGVSSLRPLLRQLDEIFNETAGPRTADGDFARTLAPACDVEEASDHYALTFDMPGLEKEDIEVELHGNRLQIRGERRVERQVEGKSTHFSERRVGKFSRTVTLPEGVDGNRIEAQYRNGVLSLVVPKAQAEQPTKIKIGEGKLSSVKSLAPNEATATPNTSAPRQAAAK